MKFPGGYRLAIVPALLAVGTSWALDDLSDKEMSNHVAQDGITMRLLLPDFDGAGPGTDVGFRINQTILHDRDGVGTSTTAGAIVHGTGVAGDRLEFTMAANSSISATVDMVGDATIAVGRQPMLNVRLDIPAFTYKSGKTYVAQSGGVLVPVSAMSSVISERMIFNVGAIVANLQLSSESQGSMMKITGSMAGGITATGYQLNDTNSGGSLFVPSIALENNGVSTALDLDIGVDIVTTGLRVQVNQLGTVAGGMDLSLSSVKFGDAATPAMGNVDLVGLNLASTVLRIAGQP